MENPNTSRSNLLYFATVAVLSLLTAFALLKAVFVSLDIDESYAAAVAYRLYLGDLPIRDLWEPHQFAGFFLYPFVALFCSLTGGTTGLIIALRIIGSLLHLLVGFLFCSTLKGRFSHRFLVILFFLHTLFLPKWVQLPEFELISYWMLLLMFVCLFRYHVMTVSSMAGSVLLFLTGVFHFVALLSYPSLLLLYPFFLFALYKNKKDNGKFLTPAVCYTLGGVLPGFLLLFCFLSYMTIPELITNLKHINSDLSHAIPLSVRMLSHAKELVVPLLSCVLMSLGVWVLKCFFTFEKKQAWALCTGVVLILSCFAGLIGSFFYEKGQFFLLWKYLPVAYGGLMAAYTEQKESETVNGIFRFLILPGFLGAFAVLLLTNMDVNTTMAKIYPAVLGTVLVLYSDLSKSMFSRIAILSLLVPILICRLYLLRVTGCVYTPVTASLEEIKEGPAAGISMLPELAEPMNENTALLKQVLTPEDNFLYIGGEPLYYLVSRATVSGASTQGTTVFNELFIDYLNEHADKNEKYPDIIMVDKELWVYPYYYASEYNVILLDWIRNWYPYVDVFENDRMILYSTHELSLSEP